MTLTYVTAVVNTNAGDKTRTPTPAVGDLIVAVAVGTGLSGPPTVTDDNADGLGTYYEGVINTGTTLLAIYVREALVGSATLTTVTSSQSGSTGGGIAIYTVSGMTRVGSAAVRSSGTGSGAGGATPAPVLSLTPLTTSIIITTLQVLTTPNVTPRTGYTERFDLGYSTPTTGWELSDLESGETSATITFGGTSPAAFNVVALELDTTSAAGSETEFLGSIPI